MQHIQNSRIFVNDQLVLLFQKHGYKAVVEGDCVSIHDFAELKICGDLWLQKSQDSVLIIQLDVRLSGFDGDRELVESVGVWGDDPTALSYAAVEQFANDSFHVILCAFFRKPPDDYVSLEEWPTAGGMVQVYAGLVTTQYGYPPPNEQGDYDLGYYTAFREQLKNVDFSPGIHWVRVFQVRLGNEEVENEVLLDNDNWLEMQSFMRTYPWPYSSEVYNIRTFIILKS